MMLKISWKDRVTNTSVLKKTKKERSMLNTIWQQKRRWLGHVLRNEVLLREIIEGRIEGKASAGRKTALAE